MIGRSLVAMLLVGAAGAARADGIAPLALSTSPFAVSTSPFAVSPSNRERGADVALTGPFALRQAQGERVEQAQGERGGQAQGERGEQAQGERNDPSQGRPTEQDLFGGPPAVPEQKLPPARQEGEAGEQGAIRHLFQQLGQTENPLSIGGQIYLRGVLSAHQGDPPSKWLLTSPNLVDTFLDVRPSDRVRGFVLARTFFDPTVDPNAPGFLGQPPPANPTVLLDQLWLKFDIEQVAFFTVGKQHVKWGTGRFWNPTDYLHIVPRDPLAVFDQRTGTTMVRVHVPWERRGWNFYAMAVLEPLTASADTGSLSPTQARGVAPSQAGTLGGLGAAARAEIVLGPSEIGAGAVLQRGHRPRFALDGSVGFWELDAYAEAALKTGSEVPLWRQVPGTTADTPLASRFETYEPAGLTPAVTAGLRWEHKYSDEDRFELGVEYFFNRTGYSDTSIYPWLLFTNSFTPFYLGQHYAGAYLALPNPGSWNHTTFILSTIGNLSDQSFVTRLDHSVVLLTYLRLETFVAVHYGASHGEFRLGIDLAPQQFGTVTTPAVSVGPSVFDAGVAVRVSL